MRLAIFTEPRLQVEPIDVRKHAYPKLVLLESIGLRFESPEVITNCI